MALNLMALLQSVGVVPPQALDSQDILVQGAKPGSTPLQGLGNRDQLEEALQASQNAPERKGMFGTKGTLREILGTVGDAFLIQSGNNPIYTPRRQQEKLSDAYAGFTGASGENPEEVLKNQQAALERLAATPGGVEIAQKAYAQMQDNQARMAASQNTTSYKNDALYLQKIDKLGKLASNIYAGTKTPEETEAATQRLIGLAQALKVDPADLGVKPGMSAEDIRAIALGNQTPYQQASIPIRQQNADAATTNAGARVTSAGAAARNAGTNVRRLAETERHNRETEKYPRGPTDSTTTYNRDSEGRLIETSTSRKSAGSKYKDGQILYKGSQKFIVRGGKAYPAN